MGKCGIFWSKLAVEIESFNLNLVTTAYGYSAKQAGKVE